MDKEIEDRTQYIKTVANALSHFMLSHKVTLADMMVALAIIQDAKEKASCPTTLSQN